MKDIDEAYRRELTPLYEKSAEIVKAYWDLRIQAPKMKRHSPTPKEVKDTVPWGVSEVYDMVKPIKKP